MDALIHRSDSIYTLTRVLESLLGSSSQLKWPLTRVAHRYAISTAVQVRIMRCGAAVEALGKSLDMSEEGICLALETPLIPGELLTMHFSIPTLRDTLDVRGMVRHSNGTKYGIEFLPLTPHQRDALRTVLSAASRQRTGLALTSLLRVIGLSKTAKAQAFDRSNGDNSAYHK